MLFLKNPPKVQLRDLVSGDPILEPARETDEDGNVRAKVDERNRAVNKPIAPWSLLTFLIRLVFSDPKWGKGEKAARAARRLTKALRKAPENEIVQLDTEDVKLVREVLKDPQGPGWDSGIVSQCENAFLAIETASEKRDEVEAVIYDVDTW